MNQKKVKAIRRQFRSLGKLEKEFKTEKKTRLKFIAGKIEPEEYDEIITTNNFRKFKKGYKK